MTHVSRRNLLAGLGAASLGVLGEKCGASSLGGNASPRPTTTGSETPPDETTPAYGATERSEDEKRLLAYIGKMGPQLLRPAEGVLRHPSISPSLAGDAYSTQLWDWDTLWTARALFELSMLQGDSALKERVKRHAAGSLLNFLDHQSPDGRIPMMMETSNPDPFGCLKPLAPDYRNQAKPVMCQLALLVADRTGDVEWLNPVFDRLLLFLDSWKAGNESQTGLLVWGDDVAIGDDNDPTTYGRPFFSSANLLLNSLYYQDLSAAVELATRLKRPADAGRLRAAVQKEGECIQKYCWDPRDRFYYTVDVQCVDHRNQLLAGFHQGMAMSWKCLPLRIQMFTGFLPMWCQLSTKEQAADLVKLHYLNQETFNAAYGVRSLSKQETMFSLVFSGNPSNWLGPVWIVANYFVWKGLRNYGYTKEAQILADKTVRLLANDLATQGSFNEYYDPDTGRPLSHKGFLDWNMLVLEMMSARP